MWRAIGYGLALGLLLFDSSIFWAHGGGPGGMAAFGRSESSWMMGYAPQVGTALLAVAFIFTASRLLIREGVAIGSRTGIAALLAALLAMAVSYPAPGLAAALLIILLGFANGNRVLLGLGILASGAFLSRYYYQMDASLLEKSGVLGLTGIALLAIRLGLRQWFAALSGENLNA